MKCIVRLAIQLISIYLYYIKKFLKNHPVFIIGMITQKKLIKIK